MNDKIQLKQELVNAYHQIVEERIDLVEKNLKAVQESRNNETKSSAGDKYETGRAMLQIEEDNCKKQLHQALLLRNQLRQIDPTKQKEKAGQGSLVFTNQGRYFISAALGQVSLREETYFCISPVSPVGRKIMGQEPGFRFEFNETEIEIRKIW